MMKSEIVFALWSLQSWKTISTLQCLVQINYMRCFFPLMFSFCEKLRINVCETVKTVPPDWWLKSEPSLKTLDLKTRGKLREKGWNVTADLPYVTMLDTQTALKTHQELLFTFQDGCFSVFLQKKWAKEEKNWASDDVFSRLWCNSLYFCASFRRKVSRLRSASTVTNCSSLASFPTRWWF